MIHNIQSCIFKRKPDGAILKTDEVWEQGIHIGGYVGGKPMNIIISAGDLKPVPVKEMYKYTLDTRICLEVNIEERA